MKPIKNDPRDLESEREDLLALMQESINPEIMKQIDWVASVVEPETEYVITISTVGAIDGEP